MKPTNKTPLASITLAAIMLALPLLAVAGTTSTGSPAKPASLAPHAHTSRHVYGAPIAPAIVGHRKSASRPHAPKQPASIGANRH